MREYLEMNGPLTASSNLEVSSTTSGALDLFLLKSSRVSILLLPSPKCERWEVRLPREVRLCCEAALLRRDPTASGCLYMLRLAKLKRRPLGMFLGRKGELHRSSEEGVTAAESSAKGRGRASMLWWWCTRGWRSMACAYCLLFFQLNWVEPRLPFRRGMKGEAGRLKLACKQSDQHTTDTDTRNVQAPSRVHRPWPTFSIVL